MSSGGLSAAEAQIATADDNETSIWHGVGEISFRPFVSNGVEKEPLSTNSPDATDEENNRRLIRVLIQQGAFEDRGRHQRRQQILGELQDLMGDWALDYSKRKKADVSSKECACRIMPFGSYCLGVHTEDSDIDVLCIVPKHVSRNDFFIEVPQVLAACDKVNKATLLTVPDAFVPVIKFQYEGVDIDLSVARLPYTSLPEDLNVADEEHLIEMTDAKDLTCLNGPRVTIELLRRVPNVPQFRMLLRCVKLWARRRGIYSNMVGFPGGVAWAIMAAHVCQLYPNMNAWMLLGKFFFCYKAWLFTSPIQIAPLEDCRAPRGAKTYMPEWDPVKLNPIHRRAMSVITPTYPAANATYNSSKSTVAIIKQEIQTAFALLEKGAEGLSQLFEPVRFFRLYKNFLEVQLLARPDSMKSYCSYVNSQLRKFIERLHQFSESGGPSGNFLEVAHPCTEYFSDPSPVVAGGAAARVPSGGAAAAAVQERGYFFIGLKFSEDVIKKMREENKQVNLTTPTQEFLAVLEPFEGTDISIKVVRKKDIPEWVKARMEAPARSSNLPPTPTHAGPAGTAAGASKRPPAGDTSGAATPETKMARIDSWPAPASVGGAAGGSKGP